MITNEEAEKNFNSNDVMEAEPAGIRRVIMPAYGFAGASPQKRQEWGADGPFMEDVQGYKFHNPKDNADQILKKNDGVLICYDAPGRVDKINKYLAENPQTFKDVVHLKKFVSFMQQETGDVWDTDINFAAGLKNAPAKEDIKPGKVFTGIKAKEAVAAFNVKEGEQFEGGIGAVQTAGKGSAYIIKDKAGMRMIQSEEFSKAYVVTNGQQANVRNNQSRDL
ncbi:MAG: hypothetical protein MSS98_02410 [Alphaproteobacteria bacterium]|nr:hypothetical protein [Alphaproteobacteria bacterium]MDY4690329.1 hypothetical protein [Alphaproteobacteria bacterium]